MAGFNQVILLGNLGADPDLKISQSGMGVLRLKVATTERYLDKQGNKKESTEWHTVVVWGKRAEGLARFLAKGMSVHIVGKIRYRSYEKDGTKRWSTEIHTDSVQVLTKKGGDAGNSGGGSSPPRASGGGNKQFSDDDIPPPDDFDGNHFDEDLPF